jgi:hypothetical protein
MAAGSATRQSSPSAAGHRRAAPGTRAQLSGTAIHYFTTAIIHSEDSTGNGKKQRSTESIDLDGDLVGRILYQPISKFDFVAGRLVDTGLQVFFPVPRWVPNRS